LRLLINDLTRHTRALSSEINAAIARVLERGWYILGPEVEAFEAEFANYAGTTRAVGVANGTDALELALRAVGVGPGDRVATVANAGMYSTTAILAIGAVPAYVDVSAESMTMDPACLAAAVQGAAAAVVTHLYGQMADMPRIMEAAAGVPVIEDCAQSHGAQRDGIKAGAWGAAGAFSFYPTKNLGALGDGGAVVTSSMGIAEQVRRLRQYGWSAKYRATERGGRNSRLDELQAAVLRTKLPHLDRWNDRRRSIAALYDARLQDLLAPENRHTGKNAGATVQGSEYVGHLYTIRSAKRDILRARLAAKGIASEVHYPIPDYRQEAVAMPVFLPVTERCCAEVLTLPCFPEMTDAEVELVCAAILRETGSGARES
jgi:dTDP-3-amino-2,3,6-trideoxy-4-keto-D-glucose/dTDP-3-amino-3,4,6-trideoxy-alpha-D-glucose/dTDP-2,6-dideoxy-D-kanosamine transaminase